MQITLSSSILTPFELVEPTSTIIFITLTGVEMILLDFMACVGSLVMMFLLRKPVYKVKGRNCHHAGYYSEWLSDEAETSNKREASTT